MTRTPPPDHDPAAFSRRREAALGTLDRGVLLLSSAPLQHASRDTERPYHPDRELYYLTGATEHGTVAVLVGGAEPRFVLFVEDTDPETELWSGPRLGPAAAAERFAPDECHPLSELEERLPPLLQQGQRLHYRLGGEGRIDRLVLEALAHARSRGSRDGSGPRGIMDPGEILDDLRLVKDAAEIERIRRAAEISVEGHRAGAATIGPGVGEWVVEAAIDGAFRAAGARGPSFETIVGAGTHGCVLHYVANTGTVGPDDLVLVDAGAEVDYYHGDITRTYPAGGRFPQRQREVYDIVEEARRAAVCAAAPGKTIAQVHDAAARALVDGLIGLGVLAGSTEELISAESHKAYFPHKTSHWLGLDVHDPGDYVRDGASRVLEPGMVFTVEPGLYFRPGHLDEQARPYEGIGIRIEDDVVVTEDGCEVLTAALPTAAADVESLVGSS